MVLMRRKDKRRGNTDEEITVASDSSIVANKGVRSLGGARSGRFAADMRASVGGYGRADKTWGVDHPWHVTHEDDLFKALCSRDRMEEGDLVKEQQQDRAAEEPVHGLSRAALKKRKAKLKKQGLSAQEATAAALQAAEEAKQRHEEKLRALEQQEEEKRQARALKKAKRQEKEIDEDLAKKEQEELELERALAGGSADEVKAKKEAEAKAKAEALREAKREQRKKDKEKKKEAKAKAVAEAEEVSEAQQADLEAREALARAYEDVQGGEVTTKSGLVVQDQRIGHGRLPLKGEMLTVKYRGRLGREGLIFGKGMLTTHFGTGAVIAGWEEGLGTMRPGGMRLLTIPPELGYGESGKGDKIPPNATLYFEVELVRIGKRKRDTVGEDEVPLPSAFQRKRIKQKTSAKGKNDGDGEGEGGLTKSQKKRRRQRKSRQSQRNADE